MCRDWNVRADAVPARVVHWNVQRPHDVWQLLPWTLLPNLLHVDSLPDGLLLPPRVDGVHRLPGRELLSSWLGDSDSLS